MNNDFLPWIRPTLLGPFWTSWGMITLAHFTIGVAAVTFGHFDDWLHSILVVSFFAAMVVTSLIAADVALLRLKLRRLPTGAAVWASSLLAPLGVWLAWGFFGLGDGSSVLETVLRIVAPIGAVPFVLRLALGRAP